MDEDHKPVPFWRAALSVLILPVNVAIVVPTFILGFSRGADFARPLADGSTLVTAFGGAFVFAGLWLMAFTIWAFYWIGKGTLAPWDPPSKLVLSGPYRYMRHPMICGVLFLLIGEAILFRSWPLGIWATLFFVTNAIYLPYKEEPDLIERFGDDYREYMRHVPRWLPRLTPWYEDGPDGR